MFNAQLINFMQKQISLLMMAAILVLSGCEGMRKASGVVYDKSTTRPLDSVFIKVLTEEGVFMYTDSSGQFFVANHMENCSFKKCKDIMVQFSKPGYHTQTFHNPDPSRDMEVQMEKQ